MPKITITKEVEVTTLSVQAGVRYWEDATVDGVVDVEGSLIPCRCEDYWCPEIDLETGKITNWEHGKTANVHYKICDNGRYRLKDEKGETIVDMEDAYVPSILCPKGTGYGDYIKMDIDESGQIQNWKVDLSDFEEE